jgi:hypothetical protein
VNLPWFPQRTCSSAVWFRATKILKIVLPVFYFNHPILIARIFSQEFFPELYEAQDYSWGISYKVFFVYAHSPYFLNREIPFSLLRAVFPLMVCGNFTGFPIFCELLRGRLPQTGGFLKQYLNI